MCSSDLSSAMNPQIRYGEDLMSRVSYVMMNKGGDKKLTDAVRGKLTEMFHEACDELKLDRDKLLEIVLVGNPIMHHLFFGLSPVELGQSPFTLATREWLDIDAKDLGLDLYAKTRISFLPLIAGHVGADTAAAYLSQMHIMNKDRKSTRLNSSHKPISYAVICLKKIKKLKKNNVFFNLHTN